MLPRAERIGTTEFRRAFDRGRVLRGGLLQVRFYRRDGVIEYSKDAAQHKNRQTRAAFVVSRKSGKATVRNSLRRRVREIYRLSAWRHDARLAGTDLLFFASATALTASNEALHGAFNELLERVARVQKGARPVQAGVSSAHAFRRLAAITSTSPSSTTSRGQSPDKKPDDKLVRETPSLDVSPDAGR